MPFGNFGVHDAQWRTKPYLTDPIHNYFFAKSLQLVRPGGIVAFITSRYTMDSHGKAALPPDFAENQRNERNRND